MFQVVRCRPKREYISRADALLLAASAAEDGPNDRSLIILSTPLSSFQGNSRRDSKRYSHSLAPVLAATLL